MEALISVAIGLYVSNDRYYLQIISDRNRESNNNERNDYLIPITQSQAISISDKEDLRIEKIKPSELNFNHYVKFP